VNVYLGGNAKPGVIGPGRAEYRSSDTATGQQALVGRIHDCVDFERGDVDYLCCD